MLFFTSAAPSVRRSRRTRRFWIGAVSTPDPASVMQDAGAALRHARGDMTEAARHAGEGFGGAARHAGDGLADAARQIGGNAAAAGEELADTARQMSTDATRQVRRNAGSARKEAGRQVRRNAAAVRATASIIPDELIPAGRDAIRKSVERMTPGRKRSRRRPLVGMLAVLACTGLALLGVQMLLKRRSSLARREGWDQSADDPITGPVDPSVDSLGMAGTFRTTPTTGLAGTSGATTIAKPVSTSSRAGLADAQGPSDATPDAMTEPATFDRDADLRAATEGMASPDPVVPGSTTSEIADRT